MFLMRAAERAHVNLSESSRYENDISYTLACVGSVFKADVSSLCASRANIFVSSSLSRLAG